MMSRKILGLALVLLACGSAYAVERQHKTAPLSEADKKLKTCEVHGDGLQLGTAVILYGDRGAVVSDYAAQKRDFPRAYSYVYGGCCVPPDPPDLQEVKFCPRCREAEAHWLAEHHTSIPKD